MIRVVLADDQRLVREGIGGLLGLSGDIEVVGEASDGFEAVDVVMRTHPDVGLFDVRMPSCTGIDALRELKKRKIELKTIMLTTFDDNDALKEAIREGACGWLLKDVSLETLTAAIKKVAAGERLVQAMTDGASEVLAADPVVFASDAPEALTAREREVLQFLARGMSNREIAESLGTAEGTVKNQCSSIFQKLGVPNRIQALLRAAELKLI